MGSGEPEPRATEQRWPPGETPPERLKREPIIGPRTTDQGWARLAWARPELAGDEPTTGPCSFSHDSCNACALRLRSPLPRAPLALGAPRQT
jgi:hypothetical protein